MYQSTATSYVFHLHGDSFLSNGIGNPPVVVLRGSPGVGHEYLLSFADLWPKYGIPVVFYDQIGCGASTHLPQTVGDTSFWQESLFIAELDNVLDHLKLRDGPGFHLLGQSWDGPLGAAFAGDRPRGLQRLYKCEQEADYESPAYQEASIVFRKMFVCRAEPVLAELVLAFQHLSEDRTVYSTIWTSIPRLSQITHDTSHDIGQEPLFQFTPRVRWITFQGGSHMCHDGGGLRERVLKVVGEFPAQHKAAVKTAA
ncbi:proline-specific peptidase [Hypoxylon sp. NC0597]|nr:proline-specific peptidase [Hypoxylon sp. NC0597]